MSRTSYLLVGTLCAVLGLTADCQGQVGYGTRTTFVSTGGTLNVNPVVTNGGTYVRMGITAGFSQLVDVQTFSPVRNFPGLVPMAPIGFGFGGGGFNQGFGGGGFNGQQMGNNFAANIPAKPKPTPELFAQAAGKFDKDKNGRLNAEELEQVATAVIAELKRTPGVDFKKLTRGAGQKDDKPPTDEEIRAAFVKQCLKYDRDEDAALDAAETKRMASALIRSLS